MSGVADPVTRAGTEPCGAVARIGELAAIQRQAAAGDAFGEAAPEALELRDARVDSRRPRARQPRPIASGRDVVARQLGQLGADLLERQPDALGEDDEG